MKVTVKGGESLSEILKRANVPGWNSPAVWNKLVPQLRSKNYNRVYPGEVIDLSPVLPQNTTKSTTKSTTPTPAPTVKDVATTAAQETVPQTPWGEVMPWEQFFDPNLAKSAIAQRTASYFDPLVAQGREGVESEFASRNLARSGARGKSVLDLYRDFADKEASMREQLYGQREGEARVDTSSALEANRYSPDPAVDSR